MVGCDQVLQCSFTILTFGEACLGGNEVDYDWVAVEGRNLIIKNLTATIKRKPGVTASLTRQPDRQMTVAAKNEL